MADDQTGNQIKIVTLVELRGADVNGVLAEIDGGDQFALTKPLRETTAKAKAAGESRTEAALRFLHDLLNIHLRVEDRAEPFGPMFQTAEGRSCTASDFRGEQNAIIAEFASEVEHPVLKARRFKHVTTRSELDELEQANVQSGLLWLDRKKSHDILTEEAQRAMHKRLFGDVWDWAGTFRQTEKNIGIDPLHIGVQLRSLLDDARYWADNGTFPPLEAGARFHHRLVQIHPFPNGNGRHSRIAADEFLKHHIGHEPIDWESGFDLIHENERRDEYLKALREADRGDYTRLLAFVGAAN